MGDLNDRLLREIGAEAFYRSFVGDLEPEKDGLLGTCPLHADHNPSFAVFDLDQGLWRCRSGCGSGDMVQFFSKMRDLPESDFPTLARAVEKEFLNGHRPVGAKRPIKKARVEKAATPEELDLWEDMAGHYLEGYPLDADYPEAFNVRVYAPRGSEKEGRLVPVHHVPSGRLVSVKLRYLKPQPPWGGRKDPIKSVNMSPHCQRCGSQANANCFKTHPDEVIRFPVGIMGLPAAEKYRDAVLAILEGEKDLLACSRRFTLEQFCPVSSSGGASSIPEGWIEYLSKRQSLSLLDADRSGVIGTNKLWKRVREAGGALRRGDLREAPGGLVKGTPESKDVYDWFQAGGTAEVLLGWGMSLPLEDLPKEEAEAAEPPATPPAGPEPPDDGGGEGSGDDPRPIVKWNSRVHEGVYGAEQALVDEGARLYSRFERLVRVVREDRLPDDQAVGKPVRDLGAPVIQELSPGALKLIVSKKVRFQRWKMTKDGGGEYVDCAPPDDAVNMLLEKGEWKFRPLDGFATAPFLRGDGSLCTTPGYDRATGIILAPDQEFDKVPEAPTLDDAVRALNFILKPFEHFPYEDACHQAATVAAMLTLAARAAIQGPCPMFLVSAPTPGTGKTMLVWMAVSAVTGKKPASTDWVRDDDEFRKTVISMGLAGDRAVLLDNVEGTVGSALLSNVLTSDEFHGRLLGKNSMVTTPLTMVWFATGNNLATRADAYRRIVRIHLDAHMEFPTKRVFTGEHSNAMAFVKKLRGSIVPALLTVLRAYHLAGHPKPENHVPTGSFEGWDDWVRCPILWAMGVDCRQGTEEAAADSEEERVSIGAILQEWHNLFPDEQPRTVRDVLYEASQPGKDLIIELFASLNFKGDDRPNLKVIGKFLSKNNKNIVGNLRLDRGVKARSGFLWTVKDVTQR